MSVNFIISARDIKKLIAQYMNIGSAVEVLYIFAALFLFGKEVACGIK